jgi:CubicO group peptidase (beta-lactamase class C family)
MRKRIFDPLGMTHTTFDFARALADNHASPHDEDHDGTPNGSFGLSMVVSFQR